jgi:hypothetical protein
MSDTKKIERKTVRIDVPVTLYLMVGVEIESDDETLESAEDATELDITDAIQNRNLTDVVQKTAEAAVDSDDVSDAIDFLVKASQDYMRLNPGARIVLAPYGPMGETVEV